MKNTKLLLCVVAAMMFIATGVANADTVVFSDDFESHSGVWNWVYGEFDGDPGTPPVVGEAWVITEGAQHNVQVLDIVVGDGDYPPRMAYDCDPNGPDGIYGTGDDNTQWLNISGFPARAYAPISAANQAVITTDMGAIVDVHFYDETVGYAGAGDSEISGVAAAGDTTGKSFHVVFVKAADAAAALNPGAVKYYDSTGTLQDTGLTHDYDEYNHVVITANFGTNTFDLNIDGAEALGLEMHNPASTLGAVLFEGMEGVGANPFFGIDNLEVSSAVPPLPPGIYIAPTEVAVNEEGETEDTFDVTLIGTPSSTVTVTVSPDNSDVSLNSEAAGDDLVLTFIAEEVQVVTVKAVDDSVEEAQILHATILSTSSVSTDATYVYGVADPNLSDVTVTIRDNDHDFVFRDDFESHSGVTNWVESDDGDPGTPPVVGEAWVVAEGRAWDVQVLDIAVGGGDYPDRMAYDCDPNGPDGIYGTGDDNTQWLNINGNNTAPVRAYAPISAAHQAVIATDMGAIVDVHFYDEAFAYLGAGWDAEISGVAAGGDPTGKSFHVVFVNAADAAAALNPGAVKYYDSTGTLQDTGLTHDYNEYNHVVITANFGTNTFDLNIDGAEALGLEMHNPASTLGAVLVEGMGDGPFFGIDNLAVSTTVPPLPPGIYITPTDVAVAEQEETQGTFDVLVVGTPSSLVTVTIDPAGSEVKLNGEAAGDNLVLTFSTEEVQTVTVTAVDDSVLEGGASHIETLSSTSASGDATYAYASGELPDVTVTITDNECGIPTTEYWDTDLNKDCDVNLVDAAILFSQWLNCSHPGDPIGCPLP